jgi:hypothetical protein
MTVVPERGSAEAATARGASAPVCVVCELIEASLRRRIFFTLVEGLGEYWFVRAMEDGGFCLRHAREVVVAGGGPGLTAAILDMLNGWSRRFEAPSRPDARIGHACYLCETERWAEQFAIGLLTGRDQAYARSQLGRLEPLCLQHGAAVLQRVPWTGVPGAARALGDRRTQAMTLVAGDVPAAIDIVAGRDPNARARSSGGAGMPKRSADGGDPEVASDRRDGWAGGSLSMRGLHLELAAGRCPACSAAGAAARAYMRWLDDPALDDEAIRDRDGVCPEHLHDARAAAPLAASRAATGSLEHWARATRVLDELESPPPDSIEVRLRRASVAARTGWAAVNGWGRAGAAARSVVDHLARPGRSVLADRALALGQRARPCVPCQAMVTAADRAIDLLGALLSGAAGVRFYQETAGLCLRHVATAVGRMETPTQHPEREIVRAHARARANEIRWELDEWVRKSSWSVRYEPPGPEASAWRRGMSFILGDDVHSTRLLATEPAEPRPAA